MSARYMARVGSMFSVEDQDTTPHIRPNDGYIREIMRAIASEYHHFDYQRIHVMLERQETNAEKPNVSNLKGDESS